MNHKIVFDREKTQVEHFFDHGLGLPRERLRYIKICYGISVYRLWDLGKMSQSYQS
jgi:hypothetical protein